MDNIYINKKQLATLKIALMSLTRDSSMFDYAIENGVFSEDDIYEYIETLGSMVDELEPENGVLMVKGIDMEDINNCVDLWGNAI